MNPQKKPTSSNAFSIGDILKKVIKKEGLGKKALAGKRLADKALSEVLGPELILHAHVAHVRLGVAQLEVDSSVLLQELEGFRRQELLEAFQKAGLNVREVRIRLNMQK